MSNNFKSTSYDYLIKLLLIGDSGAGKSCLLNRFSDDKFSQAFISTIGIDFKIKTIELDGKKIKLQIWDTAGQERFRTITTAYYRGAMGIMLAYDITDHRSFESIKNWVNNVKEHASDDVNMLLVGNKCDLVAERKVSPEEAKALAEELNIGGFIETSALSNVSVDAAFCTLARSIKARLIDMGENKTAKPKQTANINQSSFMKSFNSSCCSTK